VFSQDHQFLVYDPYRFISRDGGERVSGVGDILLNYRYQLLEEGDMKPAFAPRFSLILPTGSRDKGTGDNVVGYQWNLPFSKKLGDRVAAHANLRTDVPTACARGVGFEHGQLSPKHSLVSFNLGASAIYAVLPRFHLMLEWLGTF
jgi:hypothetical protein